MIVLDDRWGFKLYKARVPCAPLARPLRLLHLSDMHLLVRDRAKQRFIRRITDDDYDLVFLTGDIAEEPEAEPLVPGLLSRIPKYGAFAVLGNHDHHRLTARQGWTEFFTGRSVPDAPDSDGTLTKSRVEEGDRWRVLMNEAVAIDVGGQRVVVAGVDDPYTGHGDLQATMRDVKKADVLLGLVHVPTDMASFAQRGFHAIFCGHTHGGQWRLPFIGAVMTQCDLPAKYARGLHHVERTAVHVSQGLGAGRVVRMRFNCPPAAYDIRLGG